MLPSPKRLLERLGPFVFTLGATLAMAVYVQHLSLKDFDAVRDKFSDSALSISTTMLGFFLTIYTIIHSVNTEQMNVIRANGAYGRLISFLQTSLYSHAIVVGLLLLFCLPSLGSTHWEIGNYKVHLWLIFIAALAWSVAVSLRFIRIFLRLIG